MQKDQGFQTLEEYIFEEGADFMHEEDIEWLRGKGIFLKAYGYKLEEDMDTKHEDFFAIPVKDWRDFVGRTDV